jgi:hypothetical protein
MLRNTVKPHNARISGAALPRPAACDCYAAYNFLTLMPLLSFLACHKSY